MRAFLILRSSTSSTKFLAFMSVSEFDDRDKALSRDRDCRRTVYNEP